MSKRIVFCADGTWDSKDNRTNVYRFFKALTVTAGQMPFYDDGVGSDGTPLEKIFGGAFGFGLYQKIKDGYTKIAHVYESGDQVYLVGFSRGAYTARSIAGMIAACGLPTQDFDENLVETAFQAYRNKDQRAKLLATLQQKHMETAELTMVGVWDTVGSLGIPAIFGGVSPLLYGFLDTGLHPSIRNAFQALAINERRIEFPPTLWTTHAPNQNVEQVWFCGVHSDVGGGYASDSNTPATTTLSDITLAWMMSKASALGLEFASDVRQKYALPLDQKFTLDELHESWNPLWGFPKMRSIDNEAFLADSVTARCQHDPGYRPSNLQFEKNGVPLSQYQIERVVSVAPKVTGAVPQAAGAV